MADPTSERLSARLSQVKERLAKVDEDVHGLDKALGMMSVELAGVSRQIAETRADIKKFTWIVIGTFVSAVLGLVMTGGLGG